MVREYIRYLGIAVINAIFFWSSLYELMYWLDPLSLYPATVAWAIAYVVGSFEAHYLHRTFTFKSNASYKESLYWALIVYGTIMVCFRPFLSMFWSTSLRCIIESLGSQHVCIRLHDVPRTPLAGLPTRIGF